MHHARERFIERYGENPRLAALKNSILSGEAQFFAFGFSQREVWDVPYVRDNGERIIVRVLCDPKTKEAISILPPEFRAVELRRTEKQIKKRFFRDLEDNDADETLL
jgi:hypothetical protein